MLVEKDKEIKRLKEKTIGGRKAESPAVVKQNLNNSGIDSDDDALSQVYNSDNSSSDEDTLHDRSPRMSKNYLKNSNDMSSYTEIDGTSRAFIKTVLIKYLECMANQQEKESLMMEKVLFTALKVHENDLKKIEEARLNTYNQGIMSYFWSPSNNLVSHPVKPRAYNPSEKRFKR